MPHCTKKGIIMNSAAIYVRLSEEDMDKQGNIDSKSIINQKEMLITYCNEHEWNIYDIYCDDGITGMERDRPEFQRMLADCESGKVNIVICKDQSRFARDKILVTEYLQTKFMVWGIRFIGVADNVDSTSGYYLEQTDMNGMLNEWYVRNISGKINSTLDSMRKMGRFCGPFVPYGYVRDPADKNHLIPDEDVRENIIMIFNEYNSGKSMKDIALMLNQKGIPCPSVYKKMKGSAFCPRNTHGEWTVAGVQAIVNNEAYIGSVVQGKTKKRSYRSKELTFVPKEDWVRVPNKHEPIITPEMWAKAQARHNNVARSGRKRHTVCPLAGKVFCAVCGESMNRRVSTHKKNGTIYYAMYCTSAYEGKTTCGNSHSVSGKELEKACLDAINGVIRSYCDCDSLTISDMQERSLKQYSSQKKQAQQQYDKIQSRLDNLYSDKLDGIISADEYLRYKDKYSAELEKLSSQLESLDNKITEAEQRMKDGEYRQQLIQKYSDLKEFDLAVADDFIESIYVGDLTENGEREIHINLKV